MFVRYQNDVAWPKPVWGTPAVPYSNDVPRTYASNIDACIAWSMICHLTHVWTDLENRIKTVFYNKEGG